MKLPRQRLEGEFLICNDRAGGTCAHVINPINTLNAIFFTASR
jgi:hypothetical protein